MAIEIIPFEPPLPKGMTLMRAVCRDRNSLVSTCGEIRESVSIEDLVDHGGFVYLAESGGQVLGLAAMEKIREGEFELLTFPLVSDFWDQGIGCLLTNRCMKMARKLYAKKMIFEARKDCLVQMKLFPRLGFRTFAKCLCLSGQDTLKLEYSFFTERHRHRSALSLRFLH